MATSRRFFLCENLDARSPGDPELSFVALMACYAIEIAGGWRAGPYHDADARRYARQCLLAPVASELLERPNLNIARAAQALRIPADELRVAVAGHQAPLPRRTATSS